MSLFNMGAFQLHSGKLSLFHINCDFLDQDDIETLAAIAAIIVGPFDSVEGVPDGGLALAKALDEYRKDFGGLLLVDDVYTTGQSLELHRRGRPCKAFVIFARSDTPSWVYPLFRMDADV